MQEKHIMPVMNTNNFDVCSGHAFSTSSSILSLSNEQLCRICRETDKNGDLFGHCQCKGSIALAHTSCLLHWIKKSGSVTCELCKQKYITIAHVNKRFWQWKLPRIGTKGWFKLVFFASFLSMLVAFTAWIIWSRTSSSEEARQERGKKQIEYSYLVYGMLVLIAIVGMYALNFRPFMKFLSRCLVINQSITVIPNGELCKEKASSTDTLEEYNREKTNESKKHFSCKHDLPVSRETCVQVHMVEDMRYGVQGYTKLAGQKIDVADMV